MTYMEFSVFVWPWLIILIQWLGIFWILREWKRSLNGWKSTIELNDKVFKLLEEVLTEAEKRVKNAENKTTVQDSSV